MDIFWNSPLKQSVAGKTIQTSLLTCNSLRSNFISSMVASSFGSIGDDSSNVFRR